MTTITRVRTEWVGRYHVQMDADASVLDCFVVTLPPYTTDQGVCVRKQDGKSMDDAFQVALRTLNRLRAEPWQAILPPDVFQPFGVITARSFADVSRETELRNLSLVGGVERDDGAGHPDHDERVRALCRMADLLGPVPSDTTH